MDIPSDVKDAGAYQEIQSYKSRGEFAPSELYTRAFGTEPGVTSGVTVEARQAWVQEHPEAAEPDAPPEAPAPDPAEPASAAGPEPIDTSALPAMPPGWTWDGPTLPEAMRDAQELGVSAQEMRGQWLPLVVNALNSPPPTYEATVETLQTVWGSAFERNREAAQLAVERLAPNVRGVIREAGLANHVGLIRRLAELGAPLLAAREQIDRIRSDAAHPANRPGHPRHAEGQAELDALYRTAYGTRPVR